MKTLIVHNGISESISYVKLTNYQYLHLKLFNKAHLTSGEEPLYIIKCICGKYSINRVSGRNKVHCVVCNKRWIV